MADTMDDGGGVPAQLAEHVVASSEPEAPSETLARLFGEHDDADVREIVGVIDGLFDEDADERPSGGEACHDAGPRDARHEVVLEEGVRPAACADGALFAAEAAPVETATVRSTDPVRDEVVRFERDADGWVVTPESAVVGVGMAAEAAGDDDMLTAGLAFSADGTVDDRAEGVLCRHCNAFVDVVAYETWADRSDAVTVAVPAAVFAATIRDVAGTIGFAGAD